ncbi:MAG: YbhB/YbcL family Raf kinase inhibitor-like protein [Caulobacteraceae bacterium]
MRTAIALALAASLLAAGPVAAGGALALAQAPAKSSEAVAVASTAIGAGRRIAARNTAYGQNLSPEVNWSAVRGARAYALVLEDPDAAGAQPFVHWLVWNIPARTTRLAEVGLPAGAIQGRNGRGGAGYWGPHPPGGTHHYHLEVFALDAPLALGAGADRNALVAALRGHVIASGETVGLSSPPTH